MEFYKYQGTGNDFIMFNSISNPKALNLSRKEVSQLCSRRFGIGADGLIILCQSDQEDFKMLYFNADGRESTMCGNGGRCIAQFAVDQGVSGPDAIFEAVDGIHKSKVLGNGIVELEMIDVDNCVMLNQDTFVINTGSPHYVKFSNDFEDTDIVEFGKAIRFSEKYKDEGINVNLSTYKDGILHVKTYERGVEDETFSCGTGVNAAALSASVYIDDAKNSFDIQSKGGQLSVRFEKEGDMYKNIWLSGPAVFVYKGELTLGIQE